MKLTERLDVLSKFPLSQYILAFIHQMVSRVDLDYLSCVYVPHEFQKEQHLWLLILYFISFEKKYAAALILLPYNPISIFL